MAVSDDRFAPPALHHFVGLKIRILRNTMRGSSGRSGAIRIVNLVAGVLAGMGAALGGFVLFVMASQVHDDQARMALVCLPGAAITLGWLLLPLLFFGVDETVDPARFALLPISRRRLTMGMLAAACVGIPAIATAIATSGLAIGAFVRAGPAAGVVSIVTVVMIMMLCVLASRAMTSAFASMLRSRKMRDLAMILIVAMAGSIGPAQLFLSSMIERRGTTVPGNLATVLGWTPLASGHAAILDAIDGHWTFVPARLAILAVSIVGLAWWWSFTLESAMVGTESAGPGNQTGTSDQAVSGLVPQLLRPLPVGQFVAIVARDLRYYWRDPRWRASLASLVIASVFLPIALMATTEGGDRLAVSFIAMFVGMVVGITLINVFGYDGPAYALHVLTGVRGKTELRARVTSLATLVVPLFGMTAVAVWLVSGDPALIPPLFGMACASFGSSSTVSMFMATLVPYPMPKAQNPFGMSSGGATARSLSVFVGMGGSLAITAPIIVTFFLLPSWAAWAVLPAGVVWAVAAVALGSYIAGDLLDRRGPEVLQAVIPQT